MGKTISKLDTAKTNTVATVKVILALAFLVAALNLGGYLLLSDLAKNILAVIVGFTGVWILVSNVR
jgi:hypothetical protein